MTATLRPLVFLVAFAAIVVAVQPAARPAAAITPPAPWPEQVVRITALGRTYAAADVVWLKTVQLIGSDTLAKRLWPGLERWIDLTTTLDPRFDLPYFFGATLLVTDTKRAPAVDALLARGEAAIPGEFMLPMMRGFLAHFGTLDARTAAAHFHRAAGYPRAPGFVGAFARKLERQASDCGSILEDLRALAQTTSKEQAAALFAERGRILEHCTARVLSAAAVGFRLQEGRDPTIEELIRSGRVPPPWAPPGACWTIDSGDKATLGPCKAP